MSARRALNMAYAWVRDGADPEEFDLDEFEAMISMTMAELAEWEAEQKIREQETRRDLLRLAGAEIHGEEEQ